MSDHEDEQEQQRRTRRRRRIHRSQSTDVNADSPSTDQSLFHQYSKFVLQRLRKAELIPGGVDPIMAKQTRHVNNYQHAISFRQQFIEQIAADIEQIDRKVFAHFQKHKQLQENKTAKALRELEATHAKKVRELGIYNHQDVVRDLLNAYLENSTPQGQLKRIKKLEEALEQLQRQHAELVEHVQNNEHQCEQTKENHDQRITNLTTNFNEYRVEINQYRQNITKQIEQIQERLKLLEDQQEILQRKQSEHQNSIKALSEEIQQLIKDRRSDLEKLNVLTIKLDQLSNSLDQIERRLPILDRRISLIEEEMREIRSLLIPPETIQALDERLRQVELIVNRHQSEIEMSKQKVNRLDSLCDQLKEKVDQIQDKDLPKIDERLQSIDKSLNQKSSDIEEIRQTTKGILDEIDEFRQALKLINERMGKLEGKINEIDEMKLRLKRIESIEEKLDRVEERLDELERKIKDLPIPPIIEKDSNPQGSEDLFKESIKSIVDLLNLIRQEFRERLNEAKTSLDLLRNKLDQLSALLAARTPTSPAPPTKVLNPFSKRLLFKEPLKPMDLTENLWDE